jgi:hypothetical protein
MSVAAVVSTASPSRHRRLLDVRDVIAELRRMNPKMGQERLAQALAERVEEDRRLLVNACTVLIRQALTAQTIVRRRRQQNGRTPLERAQRRDLATAEVRTIAGKVRVSLVLDMPVMLISGETKALRYTTKEELDQLGGLYVQLGARMESATEMCGERWTAAEVEALLGAA